MTNKDILKLIKQINDASYLANDVWDVTHGCRRYQNIEVSVVEFNKVIDLLKNFAIQHLNYKDRIYDIYDLLNREDEDEQKL